MIPGFALLSILSEIKKTSKIAIPLIISQIILDLNGFFGTIMVTKLGDTELATYGLVWEIFITMIIFFSGLFSAVSILISHYFGAADNRNIRICFHQGIWFAIFAAPLMMLLVWLCPFILVLTKQDPDVIRLSKPAFHAFIWTIFARNLLVVLSQFFMGINKTYFITIMSVIITPLQILLSYGFLFGKFGLPKLDLRSVGYANAISYYLALIIFCCVLMFSKHFKKYQLLKNFFKIRIGMIFELIRVGTPIGITLLTEGGVFAIIAIMMGKLGTHVLAAYQISYQYLMLAFVVILALLRSIAIRVGTEVGKNNRQSARLATAVNIVVGPAVILLFSIIYIFFPDFLINLDIKNNLSDTPQLIGHAAKFLPLVGVLMIIECIRLISIGALRGLKDTKVPLIIIFINFWCVAIPLSYIFGFTFKLGGVGIWWGMIIGSLLSGTILPFRFNLLSKRINLKALITKNNPT